MVLHTIVDINDVFYQSNEFAPPTCKNIDNIYVEGEETKDGIKINRLISTNLNDYLNPQYKPGRYIH